MTTLAWTVPLLLGCRPDQLAAAAASLHSSSHVLQHATAALRTQLEPIVRGSWSGAAAETAADRAGLLAVETTRLAQYAVFLAGALSAASTALAAARARVALAVRLATEHGLAIAPDGTVDPPGLWNLLATGGSADLMSLLATQQAAMQAAAACEAMTTSALAQADSADRRVVAVLVDTTEQVRATTHRVQSMAEHQARRWSLLDPEAASEGIDALAASHDLLDGLPVDVRHQISIRRLVATTRRDQQLRDQLLSERPWLVALPLPFLGGRALGGGAAPDPIGWARLAELDARLASWRAITDTLAADPRRRLLEIGTTEDSPALAVVASGDVEQAAHVAVLIPGMGTDVAGDLARLVAQGETLRSTALSLSTQPSTHHDPRASTLTRAATDSSTDLRRPSAPRSGIATVVWLGYPAPGPLTVVSARHADRAAPRLGAFLAGIGARAALGPAPYPGPHVTVVGHSYGSLVAGLSLRTPSGAGDLVLLGSPGSGVPHAGDLAVGPGHVHVAEAPADLVADVGRIGVFGTDPGDPGFGADPIRTAAATDPPTGQPLRAARGHSDYLSPGSASLHEVAAVVAGRDDLRLPSTVAP
ncbi:MAG: alpha/beta hydrolase [Actinomycetes bacterium]